MQDIYQFIKYNKDTSLDSLRKKSLSGAVICFDLEDSIFNYLDVPNGNAVKIEYRKILTSILEKLDVEQPPIKFGIRLNSEESGQQQLDLEAIPANCKVHSIILPKVENRANIDGIVIDLKAKNIVFNELIPIIETHSGLINLEDILLSEFPVTKVGFGHCDYNYSIEAFPFFHQDSFEYWKWVDYIISILTPRKIKFINSAFLNLEDLVFFQSMLSRLQRICNGDFGQFTLTHQQTLLCGSFSEQKNYSEITLKSRLKLDIEKQFSETLITLFEAGNKGLGFTINTETKTLISPQEYLSAKQQMAKWKEKVVHFTFVGGCFPVQYDILFEDIFHQTLKRKLEVDLDIRFNINIIRYEQFENCLKKITSYHENNPIDCLVFHIRPEPFLRITKLYYKYLDANFKLRRSFNLPFFQILNPEKYDLLHLSQLPAFPVPEKPSVFHKLFVNLNYLAGYCIGNQYYALYKYLELVKKVIGYCDNHQIKLVVLGPAKRSCTFIEAVFSVRLNKFMARHLKENKINYVDGMVSNAHDGVGYFNKNGIHATKSYHDLIAKRLFERVKDLFSS